ncbi:CocE/NonD family hydrolase [Rhodoblastus acidophilus]|uniref:CocE/NonD family hydrolase n=1 Tax=Candidatus Rhodoblastus alkanivorans TaxID=2954117 RepID=A0ABS9Z226_9HYPH|nr:CocE/NonD family hydrolase [Candidatus Rhodoblastus alkanivorans]MCI4680663.1 CocE/NonD family hydrolase [Candidatus Rhodoblastus alkanivorans]MCI4681673.1 CocE/NonD family hydrolase [Candidatus Rhodoblastus alkanivorans]MDI4642721.1 CocE/NonD family hydrolase [Rhodoblastus acidophilus]
MKATKSKPGFWANLIPLKGGLSGPQLAGWTPGPAARSGLGCSILADELIEVAPSIALAADVYLPKTPGRFPAVVAFAAYSKELHTAGIPAGNNEIGSPPVFTDRGYVHIVVTRRGMGRSGGEDAVFLNEVDAEDYAKVIQWAAQQPWCDGQVVLFGTSYYGLTQLQVARLRPPALKAFFAIETCTDYFRHIGMFGGAPQPDFFALWMGANFNPMQFKLHVPPLVRALVSHIANSPLKKLWWPKLQKRMTRIMKGFERLQPVLQTREIFAALTLDGKTRASFPLSAGPSGALDAIEAPFVVVQNAGYLNLHQFGAYDLFANASTPPDRKWLIIGPAEFELPAYHWQLEALAFFDHFVYGADNGYGGQQRVRYWAAGVKDYRAAADWPLPGSAPLRLYPASQGADAVMHRLGRAPGEGTNRWAATPLGAILTPGFDDVANQILSFDMPVETEIELTGPVTVSLSFSCNEIDSHVIARTGRVARDGTYEILSIGSIRPACRRIDAERSTATEIALDIDMPEPLTPGVPVTLRFSLTPQPVVLQPGERLRLDIGSRTDLLRSDPSHGHAQFDMQVPPYYSRNTLHYGADTFLEVMVANSRERSSQ